MKKGEKEMTIKKTLTTTANHDTLSTTQITSRKMNDQYHQVEMHETIK